MINAVLISLLVYGCDWLKKSENKPTDIGAGSYLSTNSTDPKFMKYVSMKGESVEVFGTRNSQGLPDLVTQINVTLANGEVYSFYYNSSKTLLYSIAANGTIFKYDWLANSKVALTVIPNDGKTQINTEIDLTGVKSAATSTTNILVKPRTIVNDCSDIIFTPVAVEPNQKEMKGFKAGSAGTSYELTVTRCGSPSNDQIDRVYIYNQAGIGDPLGEAIAVQTGKGQYTITVPSGTAPTLDPQAVAEKLSSVLSTYCDGVGVIGGPKQSLVLSEAACGMIAAKLALTVVGAGVAAPVGTACAGLTAAMAVYCETLGASGDPGSPSIMDKINELNMLSYFKLQGNMRIHVRFLTLPPVTKGFTIAEGVSSKFTAELDDTGKPKIQSLTLSPSSPAANQGYTITVSVFCLPVGSNVTLSMVGSDGYTKSSTFPITNAAQSAGNFTLSIPGAQKGVRDDVTAKVTTPDGQTITSVNSLIFGN